MQPLDAAACSELTDLLLSCGDVVDGLDDADIEVKEALELYRSLENFIVQQGCALPTTEEDE